MLLEASSHDNNNQEIRSEADRLFSTVEKDLITLIDTTIASKCLEQSDVYDFTINEATDMIARAHKLLFEMDVSSEIDTAPQRVTLKDWWVYQLSLSRDGNITLERGWKQYSLEFAKPKLKLPLYASVAKVFMSHDHFNREVDKMLVKKGIDDKFVRTCILEWMSLHNVQEIDMNSWTIVWRSPERTDHIIDIWSDVLLSLISEIVIQAKCSVKSGESTVLLDPNKFSVMIDYIDSTYQQYDIKWAISEYLDGVSVKVAVK